MDLINTVTHDYSFAVFTEMDPMGVLAEEVTISFNVEGLSVMSAGLPCSVSDCNGLFGACKPYSVGAGCRTELCMNVSTKPCVATDGLKATFSRHLSRPC
jgi:hypothetical protein